MENFGDFVSKQILHEIGAMNVHDCLKLGLSIKFATFQL